MIFLLICHTMTVITNFLFSRLNTSVTKQFWQLKLEALLNPHLFVALLAALVGERRMSAQRFIVTLIFNWNFARKSCFARSANLVTKRITIKRTSQLGGMADLKQPINFSAVPAAVRGADGKYQNTFFSTFWLPLFFFCQGSIKNVLWLN